METDFSFVYRIILLTGFWIAVDYYAETLLLVLFFKLKANSCRGFKIINICCHSSYHLACTLMSVNILSTILEIDVWKAAFSYHTFPPDGVNLKSKNAEIQLIFVLTYYFFRIIKTYPTKCSNFVELSRTFSLTCLFLLGHYCGFIGIVLLISCMENVYELLNSVCQISEFVYQEYQISMLSYPSISLRSIYWLYMYIYVIAVRYLPAVLLLKTDGIIYSGWSVPAFKCLFLVHYTTVILHSPVSTHLLEVSKCVKKRTVPAKPASKQDMRNSYESSQQTEDKETLSIHIAQEKSANAMNRQLVVMQMVRCVVALRRKAKRIRENRKRLAEDETCSKGASN